MTAGVSRSRCATVAAAATVLAGCVVPGAALESSPEVTVTEVETALQQPVWSFQGDTLLGLTADHRLAQITWRASGSAQTRLSEPLATGRNIQISSKDDRQVFVPQPDRGKVAVLDLVNLAQVDEFDAGPAPAYLAEDAGMRVLLALSADGSAVTPVDQYGYRKLPTVGVGERRADRIEGANRGRVIDYHLYGPSGISYYKGTRRGSSVPHERGRLQLDAAVSAGDGTQVTRSYVAGRDDPVLCAVDSGRGGSGMTVLGRARLSSPIRFLGSDDLRVYAATDRDVTVLETRSFTGYPSQAIPVLRVIDYRASLPDGPARRAALSGMAIGPDRVYLTVRDQPLVVGVAKPHL